MIRGQIVGAARAAAVVAAALLLAACAAPVPHANVDELAGSRWAVLSTDGGSVEAWQHQAFPGKRPSRYRHTRKDGREALLAEASASASMLRQMVHIVPAQLGHVRFSWQVPALIAGADVSLRDHDDSPVRVVLAFDGDRTKFSAMDSVLSEMPLALTGEPMPYATLMYVWSDKHATESIVHNPRTGRIRKLVMESGSGNLSRWLDYERDIRADYLRVFGEEPGALVSVGVMTDADNTRSTAQAWYGPVRHWSPAQRVAALAAN